jgi:Sperm-tail PG-rich repeat
MYSFRGKIKEKEPNNLPGPGQYDYQDRSSVSPSFKIGNASRNVEVYSNPVGPGAYDNASKIGSAGPKYSMGNKTV